MKIFTLVIILIIAPIIFSQDEIEVYGQVDNRCNQYNLNHNTEQNNDDILWPDETTSPMRSRDLLRKTQEKEAIRYQKGIKKKVQEVLKESIIATKDNTIRLCQKVSLTQFKNQREVIACEHGVHIGLDITNNFVNDIIQKNLENDLNIKINSSFISKEYYPQFIKSQQNNAQHICEQKQYQDEVNACLFGLNQFSIYFYTSFKHDYNNNAKLKALKMAKSNCHKINNVQNRNACLIGVMLVCNNPTISLTSGGPRIDEQIKFIENKIVLSDLDNRLLQSLKNLKRNHNNHCAKINNRQKWDTKIKHCIQIEDEYNLMGAKHAHCLQGRASFKLLAKKYHDHY